MSHATRRAFLAGTAALLALVASTAGGAAAQATQCTVEAQPPFLYAGMVFGSGRVVCTTPANKIAVTVVLEKDGVEVARQTRRDCQKTTVCWNTAGAVVNDEAGDQQWCSRVWASASGTFLGERRSCEESDF